MNWRAAGRVDHAVDDVGLVLRRDAAAGGESNDLIWITENRAACGINQRGGRAIYF